MYKIEQINNYVNIIRNQDVPGKRKEIQVKIL